MRKFWTFIKDWTLPVAMIVGVLSYFAFKDIRALEPALPAARWVSSHFPPWLIFFMLLFTFTKVHPKDLWPRRAHLWLILIQVLGSVGIYLLLHPFNEVVAQGGMICVLTPIAMAAVVIGATLELELVWNIADTLNGFMAIPNLIALLGLSGVVVKLTKNHFEKERLGR